jgi:hypothetical protein
MASSCGGGAVNKEQFLSKKMNNTLAIALGVPTAALGIAGLSSPVISEFWDFIAMAVLGAAY